MGIETIIEEDTPAERRRRKVRESIIDAAEKIFSSEGANGISMRRLAEAIDYSPAAIYKYFESKDALFMAIREMFFERLLERIHAAFDEGGSTTSLCSRCMRAYIEIGMEEPNHYKMAFSENSPDAEHEHSKDELSFLAETKLVTLIEAGMANDEFRKVDPYVASKSVWASLHGLTMLMVNMDDFPDGMPGSEHVTREDVIACHTNMIIRSLS
jgi:AcrR family transcriptional regulator